MMTAAVLLGVAVLWWIVGLLSFVYWWTYEFDMTRKDLAVGCVAAVAGPALFLWCWYWRDPWEPTNLNYSHTVMHQRHPRKKATGCAS